MIIRILAAMAITALSNFAHGLEECVMDPDAATRLLAEEVQRPAREMVLALMDMGCSAEAATSTVVSSASTTEYQTYGTLAGMCLAESNQESPLRVGAAAISAAGSDPTGRDAITRVVSDFTPSTCEVFNVKQRPAGLYFDGGPGVLSLDGIPPGPDSPSN